MLDRSNGLRLRGVLALALSALVAGCANAPASPSDGQSGTAGGSPQYLLVYALDSKRFLFAGQPYDDTTIAPALSAGGKAGAVHVFVLRDAGQGLTLGDLLTVMPVLTSGDNCLYFQNSSGGMKSVSMKGKVGDQAAFCPTAENVIASVGPYAPP